MRQEAHRKGSGPSPQSCFQSPWSLIGSQQQNNFSLQSSSSSTTEHHGSKMGASNLIASPYLQLRLGCHCTAYILNSCSTFHPTIVPHFLNHFLIIGILVYGQDFTFENDDAVQTVHLFFHSLRINS